MESEIGGGEEVSCSTRNTKPIVAPHSDHLTVWGNTGAHIELDDESSRIRMGKSRDEWQGDKGKTK
jgi:hypothetical protein